MAADGSQDGVPSEEDIRGAEPLLDSIAELYEQGNYQAALEESHKAERVFPNDPLLWCQRSSILEAMHDNEGAIRAARKAIALWPGAYLYAVRLEERIGEIKGVWALLDQALADPRVCNDDKLITSLLNKKAEVLLKSGRAKEALGLLDEAIHHVPPTEHFLKAEVLDTKAKVLTELGRHDEAKQALAEAESLREEVAPRRKR